MWKHEPSWGTYWIWNNRTFSTWGAADRSVQSCKFAQGQLWVEANEPCWTYTRVPEELRGSLSTVPTTMHIDQIFPLSEILSISPFSESRDLTVWFVCRSICSSGRWDNCFVGPGMKCLIPAQNPSCFSTFFVSFCKCKVSHIRSNECKSDNKNFGHWLQWT